MLRLLWGDAISGKHEWRLKGREARKERNLPDFTNPHGSASKSSTSPGTISLSGGREKKLCTYSHSHWSKFAHWVSAPCISRVYEPPSLAADTGDFKMWATKSHQDSLPAYPHSVDRWGSQVSYYKTMGTKRSHRISHLSGNKESQSGKWKVHTVWGPPS